MSEEMLITLMSALIVLFSRILDRAIVVIELNYLSKNKKVKMFIAAFIETVIWCAFSSNVLKTGNTYSISAYILGFAIGNAFGVVLLDRLSSDVLSVRIFIPKKDGFLMKKITDEKYGATVLKANGRNDSEKLMIMVNTPKKRYKKLMNIIKENTPDAFVTVYDTKMSINGSF